MSLLFVRIYDFEKEISNRTLLGNNNTPIFWVKDHLPYLLDKLLKSLTTNPPISKLYDTPETPPSNPTDTLPFDEDLLGPYESNVRFEVFTLNRVYW